MNNYKTVSGVQCVARVGALLLCCLLPTSLLAEVSAENRVDLEKTEVALDTVITAPVQEDAVVILDASQQTRVVAATLVLPAMKAGQAAGTENSFQPVSRNVDTGLRSGNGQTEPNQMPYSLVLALIALIGLVPVSRRSQ